MLGVGIIIYILGVGGYIVGLKSYRTYIYTTHLLFVVNLSIEVFFSLLHAAMCGMQQMGWVDFLNCRIVILCSVPGGLKTSPVCRCTFKNWICIAVYSKLSQR
jgi:fumarate reductase subunit C